MYVMHGTIEVRLLLNGGGLQVNTGSRPKPTLEEKTESANPTNNDIHAFRHLFMEAYCCTSKPKPYSSDNKAHAFCLNGYFFLG